MVESSSLRLRHVAGYARIDDGGAQILGALGQQVAVFGLLARLRQIDIAIQASEAQPAHAAARFRAVGDRGMFAGQQPAGDDPIGIGQGSVQEGVGRGRCVHLEMLAFHGYHAGNCSCRYTSSQASICCARSYAARTFDRVAGASEGIERIVGQIRPHCHRLVTGLT